MYKCKNCGHIFEEGEQATWTEKHGFSSGPFEEWDGCPICQGSFKEAKKLEALRAIEMYLSAQLVQVRKEIQKVT